MGHGRNRLWTILGLLVVAFVAFSCAQSAAPTPAPAAKAPAEKAAEKPAEKAVEKPAQAKAAPAKEAQPPAPTAAPAAPKPKNLPAMISMATHSPGTVFHAKGTGLAKVASDVGPIQVVVQPFTGPPSWVPTLSAGGKPEVGIINAAEGWQAFTGKLTAKPLPPGQEMKLSYDRAFNNMRLLFVGSDLSVGLVVKKDSKFQSVTDLKGAKVGYGFAAHPGNQLQTLSNMAMAGLTKDDIQPVDFPDTTAGLRGVGEGRADAAAGAVGMGLIAEIDAKVGLRFLDTPEDPERLKQAKGVMPGGQIATLKGGSSAGIEKDTRIWSNPKTVVATTHMSDDVAYTLVKTWWDNAEKLKPVGAVFNDWTTKTYLSKSATVPYHPGAIAFYKEKGLWTAEWDKIQEGLLKGETP